MYIWGEGKRLSPYARPCCTPGRGTQQEGHEGPGSNTAHSTQSAGSWVTSLTAHLQTHHSLNHQKMLASSSSLCQALLRAENPAVNKTAKNTLEIGGYNNGGQGRINNSTHPTRSLWGLNAIIMHKVLGCWPREKAHGGHWPWGTLGTRSFSIVGLARAMLTVMRRNPELLEGEEFHHDLPNTGGPSFNLCPKQHNVKGPGTTM